MKVWCDDHLNYITDKFSTNMDIFRILSRGASLKKSTDVTTDYALPSAKQNQTRKHKEESILNQVEKETDFFHTRKHTKQVPEKEATEPVFTKQEKR